MIVSYICSGTVLARLSVKTRNQNGATQLVFPTETAKWSIFQKLRERSSPFYLPILIINKIIQNWRKLFIPSSSLPVEMVDLREKLFLYTVLYLLKRRGLLDLVGTNSVLNEHHNSLLQHINPLLPNSVDTDTQIRSPQVHLSYPPTPSLYRRSSG